MSTPPGSTPTGRLGGRYRLDRRIATGGMGEVWQGTDEVLHRTVAVKLLRREYASDPTFLERFRTEARLTASLTHPGIAQVYDFGEGGGDSSAYLVMELVPGEPLSALLTREGRLAPDRALDLVGQAAAAVDAAHAAGLVHRDVKPANLIVTPEGRVKVTDFGIARATDAVPLTRTGEVVGTAHYLSPEQALGRPATPASDVYALGLVLYEALSGRRPFTEGGALGIARAHADEPPPPLPADVPPPVRQLVDRLLAKDPAERPQRAGEVAALCASVGAGVAGLAPAVGAMADATAVAPSTAVLPATSPQPVPAPEPEPEKDRRRASPWLLPLALLGLLAGIGVGYWLLAGDTPEQSPESGGAATTGGRPTADGAATSSPPASSPSSASPTPTPTPTPTTATVAVAAEDYVGRPFKDVAAELGALGLVVQRQDVETDTAEKDTVLDVSPTGDVEVGSTVVVTTAKNAPGKQDEKGDG